MLRYLFARTPSQARNEADSAFEDAFEYRPDDVVIVSFPKSGSTWLRFMLAVLISKDPKQVDFLATHFHVPELSQTAANRGVDFSKLQRPRMLRSHATYNKHFPKVIYLIRDPRDVYVSYYHHQCKFGNYTGTMTQFLNSQSDRCLWAEHVNEWFDHAYDSKHFLLTRYEKLRSDPVSELTRVADYIGLDFDQVKIRTAVEISSFDNMRNIEDTKGLGYVKVGNPGQRFVRRGKAGGWRDELNHQDRILIEKMCGRALHRTGYGGVIESCEAA